MNLVEPKPTKRAMIDIGRKCNVNCAFCYYSHLGDLRKQGFELLSDMKHEIQQAHQRGNNYIDFTGGEPTIYPHLPALIEYALSLGMKSCVITNAICGEYGLQKLIDAGVDEFLVSIHGSQCIHNKAVGHSTAREKQTRFLHQLMDNKMSIRFNCVINSENQNELHHVAKWMLQWKPTIVNYINFNPHGDWSRDLDGMRKVVADLRKVEPELTAAIDTLESKGTGVNVRYYPMCRIRKDLRRCICNDIHVTFDPYEWDYEILPKTTEAHLHWGRVTSSNMEHKTEPCNYCCLSTICGGINRTFHCATQGEAVDCVSDSSIEDKQDFYHYRKNNVLTLQERN